MRAVVEEITDDQSLAEACAGDPYLLWAAQGFAPGVRAWSANGAVAVASPRACARDRIVLAGEPEAAAGLAALALEEMGVTFRPQGDAALVREILARLPWLRLVEEFGWMDARAVPGEAASGAEWIPESGWGEVAELLTRANPGSYAQVGMEGVARWAGSRRAAALAAVAADAWSCDEVGFISGVGTDPALRGQGLGRQVCALVTAELLQTRPVVALLVDADNDAAIALYRGLGFRWRAVASCQARISQSVLAPGELAGPAPGDSHRCS